MKKSLKLKLSLTRAANEFGVSKDTISRGLKSLDIATGPGKTFTIREIHRSISSDVKTERAGLIRAQRIAAEQANKQAADVLIDREKVISIINRRFVQPTILALENCPEAAIEWRDNVMLPILRQKLDFKS